MLPLRLDAQSFRYGPLDIAYGEVTGAGIGLRRRRFITRRTLVIAYRRAGDARPRKISFPLAASPEHLRLVDEFRARVAERWKGEANLFEMNRRLGFSNAVVFGIVALIVLLVVVGTLAALVVATH